MKTNNWKRSIIAVIVVIFYLLPFYIDVVMSFKPITNRSSFWALPESFLYFENFKNALVYGGMLRALINSFIITSSASLILIFIGAAAAYPISRLKSRLNSTILSIALAVMMVPPLSILVPLYIELKNLGGLNTYWGIIIILVTYSLPFAIFLYTNFLNTIPKALDESALIDGCSKYMIFYRIILPLLRPVTATLLIITGIGIWNDYQFSVFFLQTKDLFNITVATKVFVSGSSVNLNAAAAATLIAAFPVIILYLFLQKYFVKGLIDSAVK